MFKTIVEMRSFTTVIIVLTITFGTLFFLFTVDRWLVISEAAEHEDLIGRLERVLSLWKSSVQIQSYQPGSIIQDILLERSLLILSTSLLLCVISIGQR